MPGPPPNKNARRTNARPDWRALPSEGRQGDVPEWPMPTKPTKAVAALWDQLWHSPQAIAWEDLGWTRSVARYAITAIRAERPGAVSALLSEVRQMEDRLGLTPMSMRRLQWEISTPRPATATATGTDGGASVTSIEDWGKL